MMSKTANQEADTENPTPPKSGKSNRKSHRTHTRETVLKEFDDILDFINDQIDGSKSENDKISKQHRKFLRSLNKKLKS